MTKFSKGSFEILMGGITPRKKVVLGYVDSNHNFGIIKATSGWGVTHIVSGRSVGSYVFPSLKKAKGFVEALYSAGHQYNKFFSLKVIADVRKIYHLHTSGNYEQDN